MLLRRALFLLRPPSLAVAVSCALMTAVAFFLLPPRAFADDQFPRLGGCLIGNPHDYWDPSYQAQIARLNIAVLSVWPGWGADHGTSMEAVARKIKAMNPATMIFLYVIAESFMYPPNPAWAAVAAKLDKEGWWLFTRGSGRERVLSDFGNNTYVLNITQYARRDQNGYTFSEWFARYIVDQFARAAPSIDGFYTDNVFWTPRRDGDWKRDGVTDSHLDSQVRTWYREGYRKYFDTLKALMPGKYQIGNMTGWGSPEAVYPEYQDQLNGGVLEAMIGRSWSVETQGGWQEMMRSYRKSMSALAPPRLAMFHQVGDPADYQGFRYGFASCLMDDGYFAFNDRAAGYDRVPWFDEYEVKLGNARGAPPLAPWASGVYRRDFDGGIVLVNPKGNGPRDVTLETDFATIKGSQDREVNSGKVVRTVHLKDRDGIILLPQGGQRLPQQPQKLKLESGTP
jgi:hypothetical protein